MNKTILYTILSCILLISLASAETIIAGNNYTFSIDTIDDLFWDVAGNSSNMDGFEVHQDIYGDYSNITFAIDYRMKPDNFTIILFSNKTEEIVKEVPVYRSGRSRTKYVDRNVTVEKIIDDKTMDLPDVGKLRDDLEKKNREIMIMSIFLILSVVLLFFLLKYVVKIRKKQ